MRRLSLKVAIVAARPTVRQKIVCDRSAQPVRPPAPLPQLVSWPPSSAAEHSHGKEDGVGGEEVDE